MRVTLLNDTGSSAHCGCLAVSEAHVRMLARKGAVIHHRWFLGQLNHLKRPNQAEMVEAILKDDNLAPTLQDADAVVVNGEGSIHHGKGVVWLAALAAAKQLGKKALLINAVMQDVKGYEAILNDLDDLTVRDRHSSDFLTQKGVRHRLVPDSCLEAEFSEEPLIVLSGQIVVTDWHADRADVGRALTRLLNSRAPTFYLPFAHAMHRYVWKQIPATLAMADVVVSARHHGNYMAALAGVPFVPLGSNTHKVEGFIAMSGLPIPVVSSFRELGPAIAKARANPNLYKEFSAWLLAHKPLPTLAALGPDDPLPTQEVGAALQTLHAEAHAQWRVRQNHLKDWTLRPRSW
jgi:hypothetical protein